MNEKEDAIRDESPASNGKSQGDVEASKTQYTTIKWTFTRIIAFAALCIAYVGSQVILYFASGALTYIGKSLNTTIPNWLLTANTLCVAAICPFVGYLTDLLGRRYMVIVGAVFLIISSMVMAFAQNLTVGIVAMVFGGIGAGICELTAIAGVAEITPVRWRGVSISIVTFSILPFIPSLLYVQLTEIYTSWGWRWTLIICAIWNLLGMLGLLFCYHPPPRHNVDGLSRMEIAKRIDYFGAFLSIGGITLFLVGLQQGGYPYSWTSGHVLGPLIVGIIMIACFPAWELFGPKYPMVPKQIFQGQNIVAISLVVVFIAGMFFYSILGFFPVMLQDVFPPDPIMIGVRGLGYPFAILGGACIGNALLSYTNGHVREMFMVGGAIMTAFGGALAASTPSSVGFSTAMATISAFGNGAILVPALGVALYGCPDEYIGTTTALSLSVRFMGGAVGTSIYYNIFHNKIQQNLPAYVAKAAVGAGLPMSEAISFVTAWANPAGGGPTAVEGMKGVTMKVIEAAGLATEWAFADSLAYVWYSTIAFGLLSILACAFLPNIKPFMTNRVAVDIH